MNNMIQILQVAHSGYEVCLQPTYYNAALLIRISSLFQVFFFFFSMHGYKNCKNLNVKISLESRGATTRPNFDDYTRVSRLIARKYILSRSWYSIQSFPRKSSKEHYTRYLALHTTNTLPFIYSLFIEFSTNAFRKKYIFISYKFYREPFLCISYFSLFLISILYANPYRYEAYSKKIYVSTRPTW